ncbi:helix-turn-helix transcriptional regulator [Oceanomicrobium pacificus]|uniref:HTH luxR-type domain-containing protein n=1 Tax=Oceanomicrobium pacificus TaxID=2692916 RepID=A0A6B0TZI9_9RHOB|nr:helix-turn-helix transcriptional regulator [Oceanomicrobium pacificus]MXU66682.1 hypothetical protein [Oceanomicrobium pacificus]
MDTTDLVRPVELEAIYDGALTGHLFETILTLLKDLLPDAAVMVLGQDTVIPGNNFLLQRGLGEDAMRSFATDLVVQNRWFERQWREPEGRVFHDTDMIDRATFRKTAYYKDWLSLYGPLVCATGLVIQRSDTRQIVLELRFPETAEPRQRAQAARVLDQIGPHLVRAARIFRMTHRHPLDSEHAAHLLDLLSLPVFIVDPSCRTRSLNARAEQMTRRMENLLMTADGYLHAIDPGAEKEMRDTIARLASGYRHGSEVLSLAGRDGRKFFLSVTRIESNGPRGGAVDHFDQDPVRLAIIAQEAHVPLSLSHDALWRAFRLTNAESELALALLDGRTLGDCAQDRHVSKQTVRNQLVSIMRKTECHRQQQLVALLTRLAISASA